MAGALVMGDVLARAEQALAAGCDLLPVCNDPAAVVRLLDQLRWTRSAGFDQRYARLLGEASVQADPERLRRARALAGQAMDHVEGANDG